MAVVVRLKQAPVDDFRSTSLELLSQVSNVKAQSSLATIDILRELTLC